MGRAALPAFASRAPDLAAASFIGRHATKFMAAGVLVGFAVPPLAALAKPLLAPALVIPLALALVRLDWSAMAGLPAPARSRCVARRLHAGRLAADRLGDHDLAARTRISGEAARGAHPDGGARRRSCRTSRSPCSWASMRRSPQFVVVASTALVPFTLPPLALALLNLELAISLPEFMVRLAALVGGAFLIAGSCGASCRRRHWRHGASRSMGSQCSISSSFALAIMDGVAAFSFERPGYALLAVAMAFVFNLLLQAWAGSPSAAWAP
jgi:BASS family bile acid:Na+ symporter